MTPSPLRIVALSGGVGGARFIRGLLAWGVSAGVELDVTVIANTGDDMRLHGVQICPDLDTVMYTLGGAIEESQGWGRSGESFGVAEELTHYGVGWEWFTLGDKDIATHLARTSHLASGLTLTEATARLAARWDLPVTLLPMTDSPCETHVELHSGEVMHFEEWWVRTRASAPARRFLQAGVDDAVPAPGVEAALAAADLILLPPSNPVVSVGTILGVPGMLEAVRSARAPVVGVSPLIGGAAVRGMAETCLATIDVPATAEGVALHYRRMGVLDGWLVDDADAGCVPALESAGLAAQARPLWMTDVEATAAIAGVAVELGLSLSARGATRSA